MLFIVQIVLVLAVILGSLVLMRGGANAHHLAIRRILLLAFALVAALSIFFPVVLTRVAQAFGIGRGTDLVLYALIVSFLVFMASTAQRYRRMEESMTKLARRIALDETPRPWETGAQPPGFPGIGSGNPDDGHQAKVQKP